MEALIKGLQLVLSLSILVIIHEMGHFMFAKLFKTRVEKFYLFFNPWFTLFKTKRGETEYGIGWLPLGGYVKIAGMIDESFDREQMKKPAQPWEFRSKPVSQRLLIMLGGVMMNFIFALIIYSAVLYVWGTEYLPTENVKYGIVTDEVTREIGFENGDVILTIDGEQIENFMSVMSTIILEQSKEVKVLRNGQEKTILISDDDLATLIKEKSMLGVRLPYQFKITGFLKESPAQEAGVKIGDEIIAINNQRFQWDDEFRTLTSKLKGQTLNLTLLRNGSDTTHIAVKPTESAQLGITRDMDFANIFEMKTIKYSLLESIPAGIKKGYETSTNYLKQFKLIFSPKTKAIGELGGFITIGSIFPGVWNWESFWLMTAFISIVLAIMNLLPIPALDGGHVLFTLYEMITGRKPNEKFLEYAQIIGISILLALMIYANLNDVIKLFTR